MINNLNIEDFLKNYWQKKPLLIRSAFSNYRSPITAEELAGLACEDFIESRIISEHTRPPQWKLASGPFTESQFKGLPDSHWTLLVQGINKVYPEFDQLLDEFNFIPSWRIDDVMVSYATTEGSVGPHIDQYDVFLLQVEGTRKWMISEKDYSDEDFLPDLSLKILKDFKLESEWILEPGDMLYLPPNVAHFGVAQEDCMTFSIGFRAPSHADLLSSFVDYSIDGLSDTLRFKDSPLSTPLSGKMQSGEITTDVINNIQEILASYVKDKSRIEDWFGRFITEYMNDSHMIEENSLSAAEFAQKFSEAKSISRPAHIRANYLFNENKKLSLYINGLKIPLKTGLEQFARLYCNQRKISYEELKPFLHNKDNLINKDIMEFLCDLYNQGYLEL